VATWSEESPDQSGVVRVVVELPEVDKSDFEKNKSKNFKEMVNLRLRAAHGGYKRTVRGGGISRGEVEPG
jgi:hypothetical protein